MARFSALASLLVFVLLLFASKGGGQGPPPPAPGWELLKNASIQLTMSLNGMKVHVSGQNLYLHSSTSGSGTTHVIIPANSTAKVSGSWNYNHKSLKTSWGWQTESDCSYRVNDSHEVTIDPAHLDSLDRTALTRIEIRDQRTSGGGIHYRIISRGASATLQPGERPGLIKTAWNQNASVETHTTAYSLSNGNTVTAHDQGTIEKDYKCYFDIDVGTDNGSSEVGEQLRFPPRLQFRDFQVRPLPELDWGNLRLQGSESISIVKNSPVITEGGFPPSSLDVNWDVNLGAENPVATLEPAPSPGDKKEKFFIPEIGQTRRYRLTVDEPGRVEAIRFKLENVTQYPGVCGNGTNHMRFPQNQPCPDCNRRITTEDEEPVPVNYGGLKFKRYYERVNRCALDELPDVFFREQSSRFKMKGKKVKGDLKYTISDQLESGTPASKAVEVLVTFMDSGAAAKLSAEVKVNGEWQYALPQGDVAQGDYLLLPGDFDGDRISDFYEEYRMISDPKADDEKPEGHGHSGDGFSNLEEYRGFFTMGSLTRLSPSNKDIFIHDKEDSFPANLFIGLSNDFRNQGMVVREVRAGEFRNEVVNYSPVDTRVTEQVVIVIHDHYSMIPLLHMMQQRTQQSENNTDWTVLAAAASMGPPSKKANTLVVNSAGEFANAGLIAHEMGHLFAVKHHGAGDYFVQYEENGTRERRHVAVKHGTHSGDPECYMIYNSAYLFKPHKDAGIDELKRFVQHRARKHFCTTKAGLLHNASGVAGSAFHGNCLYQIDVKTPSK
ncbi:MAG: hypothetical protein P1V20_25445 [Verrucomicrobiales bacterium]|nr:hypothetical protein [Verrucomicrobiales bacterium]